MVNTARDGLWLFFLTLSCLAYWGVAGSINVYRSTFAGAVFEFLWLPMLAAVFLLPVLSFIFWMKKKFTIRSFFFFALVLSIFTGLMLFFEMHL
jgi:hypothetical protein